MPRNNNELSSDQVNDEEKPIESADAGEAAFNKEDIVSLQKALEEEKEKAAKFLANWQRAQADYINFKRRCEQERDEVKQFGNAALIVSLLPVVDDLERALNSVSSDIADITWVEGIRLILRKFQTVLEPQGLSEIKAIGQPFDPKFHEAVMRSPGKEGVVIEELQKGYKLKDRVIRPSMVVVGQGEEKKEKSKKQ